MGPVLHQRGRNAYAMQHFLFKSIILFTGFFLLGCTDDESSAQSYRFESTIESDSRIRSYVINLPPAYYDDDAQRFPLVLALHGTAGSARQMERMYGLNEKAAASGFIILYPEGIRGDGTFRIRSWNAGQCCDDAMRNNVNDVAFISRLIDRILTDFRVDHRRVYVTGMSNGGMMAYRLACELPGKIAAIAPVSATMMTHPCEPGRAVPVLHIHSLLDTKVPYAGGIGIGGYDFKPVDSTLHFLATRGGCEDTPERIDNGAFIMKRWRDCGDNLSIESYVTRDGGHSWPGAKEHPAWADLPSAYINANDLMWEFFQEFQLP